MKKSVKLMGLMATSLLLVTGCGTIPTLENGQEAVVTFKDDKKISVDDLYAELKSNYALEALVSITDKFILETEFADFVEDAEAYADSYMASMLQTYGSEDELLYAIQSSGAGFSTIDAYRNYIYVSYLQNHAVEEYAKDQITDDQINKYYEEEAKGDIEFSHILITVDATSESTEEEQTAATDAALAEINYIIDELRNAENTVERFNELVAEKSDDASTKENNGELGKVTYYDLSDNYDELLNAAYALEDGEFSTEVITTELGYHVVLKTASHELEALEDIKDDIKQYLADNLMTIEASSISFDTLEYYRNLYELDIVDSELNDQYNKFVTDYKNSLTQATE